MRAVLLCAGEGTRLRPLTDTLPKCLVPIAGVPLLRIWLDLCAAHQIDKVLVNVHSHADQLERFIQEYKGPVSVVIAREDTLLGSAGTLLKNREWIEQDDMFAVLYGDVLTNIDLSRMADFHLHHHFAATLGVYQVPNPSECGIVEIDAKNVITGFIEKPAKPSGNLAFTGIMIANSTILELLPTMYPADIGFHLLPRLTGCSIAYPVDAFLMDIGTQAKYALAQHTWPGPRTTA
jgi:mannose-1-phosphate guanylyltransferase